MQLRRSAAFATEAPCLHRAVPVCDRRSRERQPFRIRRHCDGLFRRCHSPLGLRPRGPPVFSPLPARAGRVSLLPLFLWERKSASFILRQKLHSRQEAMPSRVFAAATRIADANQDCESSPRFHFFRASLFAQGTYPADRCGVRDHVDAFTKQVCEVIVGKTAAVQLAVACLLARGHLLIEDIPGVGKTTLSQALARSLALGFQRIQFTSDLLPARSEERRVGKECGGRLRT